MNKKMFMLGGVLVTAVTLSACQPQSTTVEDSSMMKASPVAENAAMLPASPMMDAGTTSGVMVGGAMMLPSRTIVANASDASNLTTLVAAVTQAGLVETLSSPGPFTVFAPTNDAFNKVPKATLDSLLTPAKKADLTKILTYHVVPGKYDAASLTDGMKLVTVQGGTLTVMVKDGVEQHPAQRYDEDAQEKIGVGQDSGVERHPFQRFTVQEKQSPRQSRHAKVGEGIDAGVVLALLSRQNRL